MLQPLASSSSCNSLGSTPGQLSSLHEKLSPKNKNTRRQVCEDADQLVELDYSGVRIKLEPAFREEQEGKHIKPSWHPASSENRKTHKNGSTFHSICLTALDTLHFKCKKQFSCSILFYIRHWGFTFCNKWS